MAVARRGPEEIRRSIEANRVGLTTSIDDLQAKVRELSDWRGHLRRNPQVSLAGAAAAGFLVGGGVGALFGLFRRR